MEPPTLSPALRPVQLPCGRTVNNALAKVALYEHLGVFKGGPPNEYHFALYSEWGESNWGMVLTGNVQVASDHLTFGRDITLPSEITQESLAPYRRLASIIQGRDAEGTPAPKALAIMQISHTGRQSLNIVGGRGLRPPLGCSPVRVGSNIPNPGAIQRGFHSLLFSVPREMTADDVEHVISRFVYATQVAHESGFDGVEVHSAHGYLLAQFMSPKSNKRTDQWGLEHEDGLYLLHTIVIRIRAAVPATFVVGIKLNAGDYSKDAPTEGNRAISHILAIAQWGGVDFIEISGGDYESPDFVSGGPKSQRQAFFSDMSQQASEALEKLPRTPTSPPLPLIMLTGGLKTPALVHAALTSGHAHLAGIGRQAILRPDIPNVLQDLDTDPSTWPNTLFAQEPDFSRPSLFNRAGFKGIWNTFSKITLVGAGVEISWYEVALRYLAEKVMEARKAPYPDYRVGGLGGVIYLWAWTASKANTKKLIEPLKVHED